MTKSRMPRHAYSKGFDKAQSELRQLMQSGETPKLGGPGSRAVEAWFLGQMQTSLNVWSSKRSVTRLFGG